jgi:hypothetical protein
MLNKNGFLGSDLTVSGARKEAVIFKTNQQPVSLTG